MTPKSTPKYAFYEEVSALRKLGKAVICIQFARQTDPLKRARETREKLCVDFPEDRDFPVLRGRVAPNILFLTMEPHPMRIQLERCFAELERRSCGKLELIP